MAAKRQTGDSVTVSDTTLRTMTERMEAAQAIGHDRYSALTHQELLHIAIRHRRSIARLQDENERLRGGVRHHNDAHFDADRSLVPCCDHDLALWNTADEDVR